MKESWTKGLDPDDAKILIDDFNGCPALRKRAIVLLEDKIEAIRAKARRDENYLSPNWAYQQAGFIEREKALLEIISLFS